MGSARTSLYYYLVPVVAGVWESGQAVTRLASARQDARGGLRQVEQRKCSVQFDENERLW